jgi:arabinogalactan endo-1,4-beta-galactosidase
MLSLLKSSCLSAFVILAHVAYGQPFYFGADLSYINEMEACGAEYKVNGEVMDPYFIFKDQGCNLVRLRLWHTPAWYDQLNLGNRYSDLEDVAASIARAKALGMDVLLDFHLSDTWADPGHQVVPAAWDDVVDNQTLLGDSLRNYILAVLTRLGDDGLLPDVIQIGNETNRGILLSQEDNDQGWVLTWSRNVFLFQTALTAIKEIAATYSTDIKTAIHIADPEDVPWYIEQFDVHGFKDYDIIGISYYWQWHQPVTIPQLGQLISSLKMDYPDKEVMIFETAYGWTTQNADAANNILFNAHPSYSPLSPANQKKWMTDLTQTVIDHGGKGVIYWEPAWVSTGCATQWVTGSSWDNATFFDFDNELMEEGGVGWMSHVYEFPSSTERVSSQNTRLQLTYTDGQILIRNADILPLNFPCTLYLYAPDGRVILTHKIRSDNELINSIAVPGLTAGCYLAILTGQSSTAMCGKVCIVIP